jgi:NAD(P)-dependent dehydrogenase (short-subunit alcohol dehydrogenase family)
VHALGTVATTAAAWDALLATKGRVVNVTSGTVLGLPGSTAYATAKGGVLGFTRALASETHSTGVRVNAVMPMARTRMFEVGGGVAGSEQDKLLSQFFPPDAVSPVVVFLGWAGSPCNGEVFEVAGTAVSRIVFASGPIVAIESPEGMHASLASLGAGDLNEVDSLATSLSRKLAFSMDTARVAGGATESG